MTDTSIEWDIDANLPMYTRDYLKLQREEQKTSRLKIVLAANTTVAEYFCANHGLTGNEVKIVRDVRSIEGLRFRYEDVIRIQGWSKRPDIEEIEEVIFRTSIIMARR